MGLMMLVMLMMLTRTSWTALGLHLGVDLTSKEDMRHKHQLFVSRLHHLAPQVVMLVCHKGLSVP